MEAFHGHLFRARVLLCADNGALLINSKRSRDLKVKKKPYKNKKDFPTIYLSMCLPELSHPDP